MRGRFLFALYYSECTAELLAPLSAYNGIPFCGDEVADTMLHLSGLADDLAPGIFSKEDMRAAWTEFTQGVNPPGTYASGSL